jgi:hypothetical protein
MTNQNVPIAGEPMAIPTGFEEFGFQNKYDPFPPERARLLIMGPPGTRKTTLMAGCPRSLVIDCDDGVRSIPVKRAIYKPARDGEEIEQIVDRLVEKSANRPFDRVTFDSLDQLMDIGARRCGALLSNPVYDIRRWGMEGAGYSRLTDWIWKLLDKLFTAGYSWACIAHMAEREVSINNNKRTELRPVVYSSLLQTIVRNCELIGACTVGTESIPQKIKAPDGQIIDGAPIRQTCYKFSVADTALHVKGVSNSKARVPGFEAELIMPSPLEEKKFGWDIFADEYRRAVKAASL